MPRLMMFALVLDSILTGYPEVVSFSKMMVSSIISFLSNHRPEPLPLSLDYQFHQVVVEFSSISNLVFSRWCSTSGINKCVEGCIRAQVVATLSGDAATSFTPHLLPM